MSRRAWRKCERPDQLIAGLLEIAAVAWTWARIQWARNCSLFVRQGFASGLFRVLPAAAQVKDLGPPGVQIRLLGGVLIAASSTSRALSYSPSLIQVRARPIVAGILSCESFEERFELAAGLGVVAAEEANAGVLERRVRRRYLARCLMLVLRVSTASAGAPSLKDARVRFLRGNYAEARSQFEALLKDSQLKIPRRLAWPAPGSAKANTTRPSTCVDAAIQGRPQGGGSARPAGRDPLPARPLGGREKAAGKPCRTTRSNPAHWILPGHRDRGDFKKAGDELSGSFALTPARRDHQRSRELLLVGQAELERARMDKRLLKAFQSGG